MQEQDDLTARARRWMTDDPDPRTQEELRKLLGAALSGEGAAAAQADLADRFAGDLEFGTAGLRGVLGAGPNRMNRAVVLRTTWGLAQHLLETVPGAASRGVVVGYDGRRYSRELAHDTAGALAAAGVKALVYDALGPTPMVAFGVLDRRAAAGVMVTASHNPPEYNGFKVYAANGAQIVPPTDARIAAAIARAPGARAVPRLEPAEARARGLWVDLGADVSERYLAAVLALPAHFGGQGAADRGLCIVYTPMHGVGDKLAREALARAGFANVTSVPEQREPDGAFPTVAFPNPEEKGAMDLSFALARKVSADLVLANDPDADRLAVAVPARAGDPSPSGYVQLTGNQVGVLLGHFVLTGGTRGGGGGGDKRLVVSSVVSSPMLGVVARALGVRHEETLTGFKWIMNRAMDLEAEGATFVFGYEEALGYCVGNVVRDKDGISAALVMADLAARVRGRGKTILDELDDIHRRFGLFVSGQVNVTRKGAKGKDELAAIMDRLRAARPSRIGRHAVVAIADYQAQVRTRLAGAGGGETQKLSLPKSNVLSFELEGGSRIIARPSGTEPKAKFYFDVREAFEEGESVAAATARAQEALAHLTAAFTEVAGLA